MNESENSACRHLCLSSSSELSSLLEPLSMNQTLEVLRLMSCTQFWHQVLARGHTCAHESHTTTALTTDTSLRSNSYTNMEAMSASVMDTSVDTRAVFASSDFYDTNIHPTVNDQVVLCRAIAKQLVSDDANQTSRGRTMFEKRVAKSEHWVTTNQSSDENGKREDFHERTISDDFPPNLRPMRDPRHVMDMDSMDVKDVQDVMALSDDVSTRDACRHLANALKEKQNNGNGYHNKGKNLYDACVAQSEKWIVSDVIMDAARHKLYGVPMPSHSPPPPPPLTTSLIQLQTPSPQPQPQPLSQRWNFKDFNARAKPYFRPTMQSSFV